MSSISLTGCATGTWSSFISLGPRVLHLPHPLSADDTDLQLVRRIINVKKNDRAPDKHHHRQTERDTDQKISNRTFLDDLGALIPATRRYFTAKNKIRKKISRKKKADRQSENRKAHPPSAPWSTLVPETKRKLRFTLQSAPLRFRTAFQFPIPPQHEDDESGKREHGSNSAEADDIGDQETVSLFQSWGRSDNRRATTDRWANQSGWQEASISPDANLAAKIRCRRNSERSYRPALKG